MGEESSRDETKFGENERRTERKDQRDIDSDKIVEIGQGKKIGEGPEK